MKTLGLIGGMSWESSALYYRIINETVKAQLGNLHSCHSLLYSVDFAEVEELQRAGNWKVLGEQMAGAAQRLEAGGADLIVLCTNTMHKLSSYILSATTVPFLHITDPTAEAILGVGLHKVALLGTRFTMTEAFYKARLADLYGLTVLVPSGSDIDIVHRIIYEELVLGIIREESRAEYIRIIHKLSQQGAEGIILGCTEITLLIKQSDVTVLLFNTTRLHAEQAAIRLLAL